MIKYLPKAILHSCLFLIFYVTSNAQTQIIINEFSQGDAGDHDWIELVVTEDSADIRGVYFTSTSKSPDYSTKSIQLSTTLGAFTSVKKGFIIVIYKAGAKDTNLPADDVDFTTNSRIIIPSDNSTYLEGSPVWPGFANSAGDNIGLLTAGGVGIHAVSYGNAAVASSLFGPGSWGQAIIPNNIDDGASGSSDNSACYKQQTPGQASNSANWTVRTDGAASPGVIDGTDDSGTSAPSINFIINEFSQGDMADHDWIELVVTKDGADIRGVYFTTTTSPNASDYSTKSVQLSKTLGAFKSVKKGFIIVIYKANNRDTNLPGDDLDSTTNSRIIIPSDDPTYLEGSPVWPAFKNTAGDNIGLLTDGVGGIHAVSYGNAAMTSSLFGPGTWGQIIIPSNVIEGKCANYIEGTDGQAGNSANWADGTAAAATPGSLNGGNNNALPVELVSFSAILKDNAVQLNWMTATEVNNYGFDIERKREGANWNTLGFVEGHGNTNSPKEYTYIDNDMAAAGKYFYRLKQIDNDGTYEYSKSIFVDLDAPVKFDLKQNFPNPFNPSTIISFNLPYNEYVTLNVFNAIGEKVQTLFEGNLDAGIHMYNFIGDELPSGLYVYMLSTNSLLQTKKMLLLK